MSKSSIFIAAATSVAVLAGFLLPTMYGVSLDAQANEVSSRTDIKADRRAKKPSRHGQVHYDPISFADLPGWQDDDHVSALGAYIKSCKRVLRVVEGGHISGKKAPHPGMLSACFHAVQLQVTKPTRREARLFFESHFVPNRIIHDDKDGRLTGYYEPVINGSRKRTAKYSAPIYQRPKSLLRKVRHAVKKQRLHDLINRFKRMPTRQQIDNGALAGNGLELLYLEDPVDVFFLQIQGSGRIRLRDGRFVRVTYDGKNGHPYASVAQYLIDKKLFPAQRKSLAALGTWLKSNKKHGRKAMWRNKSYVFFREIHKTKDEGALGVMKIPLTPGRSLAVDRRYHAIGSPIYVSSPGIKHASGNRRNGFHRLMIAQDVGSAIKGPERGDIFFGSGDRAGKQAMVTKHSGTFYVLLPDFSDGDQIIAGETAPRAVRHAQR